MYIKARAKQFLISNYSFSTQAQWGERNGLNGADSDGTISSVENFFEDESLGSNSSDSEDDASEDFQNKGKKSTCNVFRIPDKGPVPISQAEHYAYRSKSLLEMSFDEFVMFNFG